MEQRGDLRDASARNARTGVSEAAAEPFGPLEANHGHSRPPRAQGSLGRSWRSAVVVRVPRHERRMAGPSGAASIPVRGRLRTPKWRIGDRTGQGSPKGPVGPSEAELARQGVTLARFGIGIACTDATATRAKRAIVSDWDPSSARKLVFGRSIGSSNPNPADTCPGPCPTVVVGCLRAQWERRSFRAIKQDLACSLTPFQTSARSLSPRPAGRSWRSSPPSFQPRSSRGALRRRPPVLSE